MDVDEYVKRHLNSNTWRKLPPGYAGHLPGIATHTFGRTFGAAGEAAENTTFRKQVTQGRLPKDGKPTQPLILEKVKRDSPVVPRVPGYTGWVPGSANHVFGKTYAESCRRGALAETALLKNANPSMLTECVDDRPLVVTMKSDLAVAATGKLKATEMREETREFQTLKKAREFVPGLPIKEELPDIAQDTTGSLPGYTGFHPSERHIYSQTKGNTTRKINTVQDINERPDQFKTYGADRPLVGKHLQGAPPPGYTGFIPSRVNHVFGQTFSREMENAQSAHHAVLDKSMSRSWAAPNTMSNLGDERPNGVFSTIPTGSVNFDSTQPPLERGAIPGYTGHRPGLKHNFGMTYAASAPKSWEATRTFPSLAGSTRPRGYVFHTLDTSELPTHQALSPTRGRIPGYTGHCPGHIYEHSQTYGTLRGC